MDENEKYKDERRKTIEKIKVSNDADDICRMLRTYGISANDDIVDIIYSRKDDFSKDEIGRMLLIIQLSIKLGKASTEVCEECIHLLNDYLVSKIKNAKNLKDITNCFMNMCHDGSVVEAAFSRKDDFSGKEKEELFDEIARSSQTNKEILKEIVKESNNWYVLNNAIVNKNVDEDVVRALWDRRNNFGEKAINFIYRLILICEASPKDLLIEAFNNYSPKANDMRDLPMTCVIFNQNLDQEIYERLLSKLKELRGEQSFNMSKEEIEFRKKFDYSTSRAQFIFRPPSEYNIFPAYFEFIKLVENVGQIKPNVVEDYIKHILKQEKYLKAYQKLMSFRCQKLNSLELSGILFETKDPEVFSHILNSNNDNFLLVLSAFSQASTVPDFATIKEDMLRLRPYLSALNVEVIEVGTYNKDDFKEPESRMLAAFYIMLNLDNISPKSVEKFITTCLGPAYLAWYEDLKKDKKPVGPNLSS